MEWLLLFVPLDLFEKGLQQLGPSAKEVALVAATAGMAALLLGVGVVALRAGWTGGRLLGLGLALWLLVTGVITPVTGGCPFGADLLLSPVLVNASYLLVFLGYTTALAGGALLGQRAESRPGPAGAREGAAGGERPAASRRVLLAGTAAAYSRWSRRWHRVTRQRGSTSCPWGSARSSAALPLAASCIRPYGPCSASGPFGPVQTRQGPSACRRRGQRRSTRATRAERRVGAARLTVISITDAMNNMLSLAVAM